MRFKKFFSTVGVLSALFLTTNVFADKSEEANLKGNHGLLLIQQGKMEDGLAELKQATQIDPESGAWHMNYGSILFQKSTPYVNSGRVSEARDLLDESERELGDAVKLFRGEEEQMPKAQCLYLMGDIEFYARKNVDKAKEYYEKALQSAPTHPGALDGVKRCNTVLMDEKMKQAQSSTASSPAAKVTVASADVSKKQDMGAKTDEVVLNSGQIADGYIVEHDKGGLWLEMGPGAKVYFSNSEMKSVNGQPVNAGEVPAAKASAPTRMVIRNAEKPDVIGAWDLVALKAKDPSEKAKDLPYQRWTFREDGVFKQIRASRPITDADVKLNNATPVAMKYQVADSILRIEHFNPPVTVAMRSFIVTKTFPEKMGSEPEKEGDMIIAIYRTDYNEPDMMWILRKITAGTK